ncbi:MULTISPECIES: amidase family protein [Maribacter]|uniref:Amidase n=1 Tax=Maribacter flavus TaxID=1658664 RepID=A0A5B2TQW1_9FLAO|nr:MULTISPECIES: amidase family protein [Maribacter]KAA2216443.1 amidase [Maribacter flavus]MDC6406696.1 amidase family protein [Maribacter sp. PR66]MEE1973862.1 amidase family protein [Maribacter flavus]
MKKLSMLFVIGLLLSCKNESAEQKGIVLWEPYNDSAEVAANADHEISRMRYKLIQSKVLDKNDVFLPLYHEVSKMTETEYEALKPLILEQDIFSIQKHIDANTLSYEKLVLFYLYRIYKYELNNETTLNTIIALNKEVVAEARKLDEQKKKGTLPEVRHPIFGMPILLKDNINTTGMKTTAGSIALMNNEVADSFIVQRLKENGALILGKVNLSEWAYFLCSGCPVGYSAVGGQTLNPYGRRIFETGGSSSGSGTSVAANYGVAAVGTETSGSILSPSSQNSVVGLKPTIGLLSRSGIVPISSTLDTPGPMTKNVVDNGILLSAMLGFDTSDSKSVREEFPGILSAGLQPEDFSVMRLGAMVPLMERDSIYKETIEALKSAGAHIVEFTPPEVDMDGFLSILNIDMRNDLPEYLKAYSNPESVKISSVADAVHFNNTDSLTRIPYGQELFEGILADSTTAEGLEEIKAKLENSGRTFFDTAMDAHNLDAILSINNYHAGYAAVAKYPALTIPMGYKSSGEPIGLTFIGKPFSEAHLLRIGKAFETSFPKRKMPKDYQ